MRITISDVECPKCHHIFEYDSGWSEFKPFQYKSDAELEIKELQKRYPNSKYTLEPCSGGWIISGSD